MSVTINEGNCQLGPEDRKPRCQITYRMALEQLYSLRARFKDCQQIVDENGNVINAFPPQTLFRRPVTGNDTFLPVDPNTGFQNMIRVMSFQDIGCNGTGPNINCCGKIRLHPEGFFGGLPSALFYPDSQGNPPVPLYLTENYFDVDFNVWQEITGYSILWEYLGQSGVNSPRMVAVGWETGCLRDPGIYRVTIMDACGNILRSSFNIGQTNPSMQFASPFNPQNNQNQVAFYETTINASLQQNENPRVYVTPYLDANNNILPGAIFDTAWASIGCTVDFEVQVDNCCGPTRIKVSTAGTLGSAPPTVIFSQIMQQDPTSTNTTTRYIFKNFDILDFNLIVDVTDACGNVLNRTVTIDRSVPVYYRNPRINVLSTTGFNPQNDPRPHDLIYLDNVTFKGAQRFTGLFYGAHARQAPLTREAPFRTINNQGTVSQNRRAWLNGASVAPDEVSYLRLFPAFVRVLNVNPVPSVDFSLGATGTGLYDRAWFVWDPTATGPVNHATVGLDVNYHLIGPLYGVYRITAPYQCSQARRNPLPGFPNFSGLIARDYAEKFAYHGYRGENDVVTGLIPETQAPTSVTGNWGTRVTKGVGDFDSVLTHNQRRIPFALSHSTFIAVSQFLYTRPVNVSVSTPGVLPTKLLSSSVYIQYDSVTGQGLQNASVHEIALTVEDNFNTQIPNSSMFSSTDVRITLRETFSTRRVTAEIEQSVNNLLGLVFNLATVVQALTDYVFDTPIFTGPPTCAPVPPTATTRRTRFVTAFGTTGQFFNGVTSSVMTAFNSNRVDLFRRGAFAKFLDQVVGSGPNQVPLNAGQISTLQNQLFNQSFTLTNVIQTFVSFMVAPHQETTVARVLLLGTLNFGDSAFDKSNMQVAVSKRPGNNGSWFDLYVDGARRGVAFSSPTTYSIPAMTVRQGFNGLPAAINMTAQQGNPDPCNNIPITIAGIDTLFSSVTVNSYNLPAASVQLNYGLLDPSVYQSASWIREISYNNPGNFNNRAVSFVMRGSSRYAFNDFSFYGGYTALTDVDNAINLTSGIAGEPASVPSSPLEGLTDNVQTSLPSPFLEDTIWNIWNFGHGAFPMNAVIAHAPNLGDAFNATLQRNLFFVNAAVGRYMLGYFSGLTGINNNWGTGSVFYAGSFSSGFASLAAPTVYFNDSVNLAQNDGPPFINPGNAFIFFENVTFPHLISALVNAMRNRKRELFSETAFPDTGRMYSNAGSAAGPDYAFNYSEDYTPINSYEPNPF